MSLASVGLDRKNGAPPKVHSLNCISTAMSTTSCCSKYVNGDSEVLYSKLRIHNTFITFPENTQPSLEGFYQPRLIRSWPTSKVDEADTEIVVPGNAEGQVVPNTEADHDDTSDFWPVSTSVDAIANAPWRRNAVDDCTEATTIVAGGATAWVAGEEGKSCGSADSNSFEMAAPQVEALLNFPDRHETHFLGSDELPTRGSSNHYIKKCKPCAFLLKTCRNGIECPFCHLCDIAEKRRRKKERVELRRAIKSVRATASNLGNRAPFLPGLLRPNMATPSQENRFWRPSRSGT